MEWSLRLKPLRLFLRTEKYRPEVFIIYNRCLEMMDDDSRSYVDGPVHLHPGDMSLNGIGAVEGPEAALSIMAWRKPCSIAWSRMETICTRRV